MRSNVFWNRLRSSVNWMNCFGALARESGQRRVPLPPAMITGMILSVMLAPPCAVLCSVPELSLDIAFGRKAPDQRQAIFKQRRSSLFRPRLNIATHFGCIARWTQMDDAAVLKGDSQTVDIALL
ncbi:hypothetical protein D3C87_1348020 [compost metagenome]